jgi:tripartite-type tricarboxylate transporter receptor subunit TctC
MFKKIFFHTGLMLLAVSAATSVTAQTTSAAAYPAKPIHLIVTFSSGGAPDTLARILAERLSTAWGQGVIVENKPGSGGNIGSDYVARAAPDGYNIVVGTVGTHSINGAIYAAMPYDMVKDFTPITLLASTPNVLVVNNDSPAKNLKDFIALGKKEGRMNFASSGTGTSIHISGELFKTMTAIDMTHIPYKGRATAIPDLLGGRVTMMFDNLPSSLPLIREGKLRALGVTSLQRSPAAPDIPTIAESGLPGFEAVSWFALFAPANTPKPIIDKLQLEVSKIINSPAVAKRLLDLGLEPIGSSPEQLASHQKSEITKWAKVVKDSGAKID